MKPTPAMKPQHKISPFIAHYGSYAKYLRASFAQYEPRDYTLDFIIAAARKIDPDVTLHFEELFVRMKNPDEIHYTFIFSDNSTLNAIRHRSGQLHFKIST